MGYIIVGWNTNKRNIIVARHLNCFKEATDVLYEYIRSSHTDKITSYSIFNEASELEDLNDENVEVNALVLDKADINKILRTDKINKLIND
jgi:hypothetical protein